MPIYEYRCSACGFQTEILQSFSDPPEKHCEECGKPTLKKMVSAAGFHLSGSGWYNTDYKNKTPEKTSHTDTQEKTTAPDTATTTEKKVDSTAKTEEK